MPERNDKELLELAAKAAGTLGRWVEQCPDDGHPVYRCGIGNGGWSTPLWNPLTDDGDALRLAVSLRLDIKFLDGFKQVCCRRSDDRDNFEMHGLVGYGEGADPWVSAENVRRAIVRAAAEIGANMQS